ncbi:sugar MFS transporter [Chryseolinea sp. T2]|uniref:sugar MFS transporter n=1 Tax=Chryseolinea sp. T2 TaxID=3129255 RepID=UPI003076EF2A
MSAQPKSSYALSMIILGALYFVLGFVTWVNGTLIPYFKIACELQTDLQSFLVATSFFIAYAAMAIPSSFVLKATGYKKGMAAGLMVMALGAILFVPAAQSRNFSMFLTALFILGTGSALLQTAQNPYVSIIGPIESAGSRISMMGICNKVAGILAGLIFGAIALKNTDTLVESLKTMDAATKVETLNELASRVILPYAMIAGVLVLLAVAILFSNLPDIQDDGGDAGPETKLSTTKTSVFQFPHVLLGMAAIFLYVGVEVMAGDTIISYGISLGISIADARFFTQYTLSFMLLGYVVGIFAIPKYISQSAALKWCAILGVIFTVLAVTTSGYVSVFFIASLGLANSLMWPAIFPLGIDGLGKFTKIGSALLVMGIAGGAILPLVYGWLSLHSSSQLAYVMMIPCYLYILYFALKGHRAGKTA